MRKPTRAKATKANQNFLLTNKKEDAIISLQGKERGDSQDLPSRARMSFAPSLSQKSKEQLKEKNKNFSKNLLTNQKRNDTIITVR